MSRITDVLSTEVIPRNHPSEVWGRKPLIRCGTWITPVLGNFLVQESQGVAAPLGPLARFTSQGARRVGLSDLHGALPLHPRLGRRMEQQSLMHSPRFERLCRDRDACCLCVYCENF